MSYASDDSVSCSSETEAGTKLSRRRPGRRDVPASLIPLLRGSGNLESNASTVPEGLTTLEDLDMTRDDLAPACGIIFGAAMSVRIWAFLSYGGYFLLH
jgi:hypothetical protein